jgi:polysaccharide pyruvyl transferase CsaB
MARKALLCGYYGEHNLGDDALLEVLLDQMPEGWIPLVTARDEAAVRDRHGVATTDRTSLRGVHAALAGCDALVLGGGSLLQDATSLLSLLYYASLILAARRRGLPILLWGQGLGPLRRRRSRVLVRGLLRLASAISWRDADSAALAERWGVRGLLGSDPVWALPGGEGTRAPVAGGGPIVLCWRPVAGLAPAGWRALLEGVERLAEEADLPVLWLPFHRDQDGGLLGRLRADGLLPQRLGARSREVGAADPGQARALFAGAGLVLAMRLHGLILAALSGAPCAALSYDPKVAAAATAIGCPCQELDDLPGPDALLAGWRGCLNRPPSAARIAELRQAAGIHRRVLESLAA